MKKFHIFLIPLFALALLLVGCSGPTNVEGEAEDDSAKTQVGVPGTDMMWNGELLSGKHTVILKTSEGDITFELDADAAPKTVTNFVMLAKTGYYDALTFHRVIPDFMIQGGDPNGNGTGGESVFGGSFEDEIHAESYDLGERLLRDESEGQELPPELLDASVEDYLTLQGYRFNDSLASLPMSRGAIAMANRGPNTNGSQFFIVQRKDGTPWLEGRHTVFGNVTDGMDVVDTIANAETGPNDQPVDAITFTVEVSD